MPHQLALDDKPYVAETKQAEEEEPTESHPPGAMTLANKASSRSPTAPLVAKPETEPQVAFVSRKQAGNGIVLDSPTGSGEAEQDASHSSGIS